MNIWIRLKNSKKPKLPKRKCFSDKLNGSRCSKKKYLYAQEVWKEMKCRSLKDYTLIYMINDVLLFADIFENFRNLSLSIYGLDPCWYYASPGLSWDAMFKITGGKLETIRDREMYNMIEKGIGGGMVNAVKRYAKADGKYIHNTKTKKVPRRLKTWMKRKSRYPGFKKSFIKKNPSYLLYLDANNLDGWAMCQLAYWRIQI